MWEMQALSLGQEDPLEKEMAAHSSPLAWKIPWTEEPGRLQSMGSQESDTTERPHFLSFSVAGTVLGLRGTLVTSQKSLLSWGVFWVKEADVSTEGNRQVSCGRR